MDHEELQLLAEELFDRHLTFIVRSCSELTLPAIPAYVEKLLIFTGDGWAEHPYSIIPDDDVEGCEWLKVHTGNDPALFKIASLNGKFPGYLVIPDNSRSAVSERTRTSKFTRRFCQERRFKQLGIESRSFGEVIQRTGVPRALIAYRLAQSVLTARNGDYSDAWECIQTLTELPEQTALELLAQSNHDPSNSLSVSYVPGILAGAQVLLELWGAPRSELHAESKEESSPQEDPTVQEIKALAAISRPGKRKRTRKGKKRR